MNNQPYIKVNNISKSFGQVVANHNVSLSIYGGEVHALLGENGAGKSTLMNMLSGIYSPDSGSIFVHGKEVVFSSPKDAINCGVGMIHQHFKLIEVMNVRENIMLGQKNGFFINNAQVDKKINRICTKYGFQLELEKKIYEMSVGERQIVEMVKVLYRGADILILDEPTTVFTPQETEKLFTIMRKMKENGCAIIFISHKMDEVMEIADKITVLRKGETVKTLHKDETTPKELTELMVGHKVDLSIKKIPVKNTDDLLKVKNLTLYSDEGAEVLKDVSFSIKAGEILGVAGIANSGQKELCESIVGIQKPASGEIWFENDNLIGKTTKQIIDKGISMSFVPEDRLGMGLVPSMDMVGNFLLKSYHKQKSFLLDTKPAKERAEIVMKELSIKTPSIYHQIKDLSGGNIQKILVGRELDSNPKVLIMAYPSRGLDINTCYAIYDLMNKQKENGVAILFIGEDLDVLQQLSDRIMVMCGGEVTGVVNTDEITKEELGLLMVGHKAEAGGEVHV